MLKRKGVQGFLRVLAMGRFDHAVDIVGDGPYLPTLRQIAGGLEAEVRFWGWLDNPSPQLQQLYEAASIFILPSEAENFPVALLEAMAAGLVIITTRGTGCAEVVGEAALLVAPKDAAAIRQALARLLRDATLRRRLGEAARRRLETQFHWSVVAARYVEVYQQHTNGRWC